MKKAEPTVYKRIKLVIAGDGGVGKSSLVARLCKDTFSHVYDPTIGADFMTCAVLTPEGTVSVLFHSMSEP